MHAGTMTTGNTMMGTPSYLAPEQVLGKQIDERVDIWAFGVGLYKILTGQPPFYGEHPAALMYSIVNESDVQFPDYIPEKLTDLITRCLAKDPGARPSGFAELADALEKLQKGMGHEVTEVSAAITNISELADRSSRRNPYLNRLMIKSPKDFYGRDREVRKIYSRLDAPQPQSISVVGDRRIGKSSLLNYIYTKVNRRKYMQNHSSTIFAYLDFQNTVDIDVEKFIDFLFTVFSFETGDGSKYTKRPNTLEQLKNVIAEINDTGTRMVIMMDEFELVTKNEKFEEDFFSFLRSLANSYKVAYVTSSRDELQQMCHNQDISDSPFFNIFSNLPLRPFSHEEAMELILKPSEREGVPLEPYAGSIIEIAGYFPFFLQIACSSMFESLADNPEKEPDWNAVSDAFMEEALPHYSFIWDRFSDLLRENLLRIAEGKPVGAKFEYINEDLIRRGYLRDEEGTLRLCSSSFADFVRKKQSASRGGASGLSSLFGRFRRSKS
jgi:serine/threonine protein kinase